MKTITKPVVTRCSHRLYEARDTTTFLKLFTDHCGIQLEHLLERIVDIDAVAALVLGGSIPLGTATGGSDVDVFVVVESSSALRGGLSSQFDGLSNEEVLFAFEDKRSEDVLELAHYCVLVREVQVDFIFIGIAGVDALAARARSARANLTFDEIRLFGRLKSGWELRPARQDYAQRFAELRLDRSLEIQFVVKYLRNALRDLENARLAISDCPPLTVCLTRSAVEQCLLARLAAAGIPALGSKWIRLMVRRPEALAADPALARQIARTGLDLLLSSVALGAEELEHLVQAGAEFFNQIRREIERDLAMRIAISRCRQIYDPLAGGNHE